MDKAVVKQYDLGFKALVNYRPGTSDEFIIRTILIDRSEYQLFVGCNPRVIFDVGANIGATAILFANHYPNALIFAFEPEPENFKLLCENVKAYENIQPYNVALGAKTEDRELRASEDGTNLGGFSLHNVGTREGASQVIQVVDIIEFMNSVSVPKIDLIKVDTEGCEYEILAALASDGKLPQFIMGEGHGVNDFAMFDMLSDSHEISVHKEMPARCYPFYARRKDAPGA